MDLILWRHADAADGSPDAARELTPKGVKQAAVMAAWLRRELREPVTVLASSAARAQQTARAYTDAVQTQPGLAVGASPARILQTAGWPDTPGSVVVVGHQPALGAAAALALTGKALPWSIRKGAIWWLRSGGAEPPLVVAVITPRLVRRPKRR